MTYQEFVNKYNGQYVDVDGYPEDWKWQCFDLAQKYCQEVINVPDYVLAGCGVVKKLLVPPERYEVDEYFDEVDVHAMQQGDICIWDEGVAGHIAIYDHYDGTNCWYFSQNPNPSQIMIINMNGHHAFRRKQPKPPQPTPQVTPNVERDEYKNQIQVLDGITELRVREQPNTDGKIIGCATPGYYNYYEIYQKDINDYLWYKIADNQWIASEEDKWTKVYPAKQDEYINFKVLEKKDGYALVDLGKCWVKE